MAVHPTLMPHTVCWKADPKLVWTMVVTNAITFLSYLSICLTLFYLVRRTRRVIARDWALFVVGFALFIVACGSTHLMEVVTTWTPVFWVDAGTNIVTAVLSALVAFMLSRRASTIGFSINDYAERLQNTESEKAKMLDSLLAAQKLEDWSKMSAVVSHEINNPLEAVGNLLFLIQQTPGASPEIARYVTQAREEVDRVMTISRSSLSFFRESALPERVDLHAAAESVRFLLDAMIRRRGIVLEVEAEGDTTVQAFPGETRQVLLNLVRNACEASRGDGSKVLVQLRGDESAVEVLVCDEGIGMAPEMLATLFTFGLTTKGDAGNGLGLWTVKHLMTKHGGDVKVESTPGAGTRFRLCWPRVFGAHTSGEVAPAKAVAAMV